MKNVIKIVQFGHGKEAEDVPMYIFCKSAEEVADHAKIFRRAPDNPEGYQREVDRARLSEGKLGVVGYLRKQMGVFPTSVLVNIRVDDGIISFNSKMELGPNIWLGKLEIPDEVVWYLLDGQHRVEGLKLAMIEDDSFKEYPLIVTLTNQTKFYEMVMFYLVNSRTRAVSTGLAYRILQAMHYDRSPAWIQEQIMTGADRRKAIAATIVDLLNMKTTSPFYGRIREIGEPPSDNHLTTDKTMTRYVTEILKETTFKGMYDEDVADLLVAYWTAISEIYPSCFDKDSHNLYLLMSTIGLSSLTRLFPTIYAYAAGDGDVSKEGMKKYVEYLLEETRSPRLNVDIRTPITEEWWHKTHGPAVAKGTGEGLYKRVSEWLAEKIGLEAKQRRG